MTDENKEEYLAKHVGFLSKLKLSARAVDQYRKLYNTLCRPCQIKVEKNPTMQLEEYCVNCQNRIKYRIDKIKNMLGV